MMIMNVGEIILRGNVTTYSYIFYTREATQMATLQPCIITFFMTECIGAS